MNNCRSTVRTFVLDFQHFPKILRLVGLVFIVTACQQRKAGSNGSILGSAGKCETDYYSLHFESRAKPDPKYTQVAMLPGILDQYIDDAANVGLHASKYTIGNATGGKNEVLTLSLSAIRPDLQATAPTIFIAGLLHPRELMSTEVVLGNIKHAISQYRDKQSPWRKYLSEFVVWFVPMANPTGRNYVQDNDSFWRKTLQLKTSPAVGTFQTGIVSAAVSKPTGVDINRNFPTEWEIPSDPPSQTTSEDSQEYRGPSPASEPETSALINHTNIFPPVAAIDWHSFGEKVLFPYGSRNSKLHDRGLYAEVGQSLAAQLFQDCDSDTYQSGEPWALMYPVSGSWFVDLHHRIGTLSFLIELNSNRVGFQPPFDLWVEETVTKSQLAFDKLMEVVSTQTLFGTIQDINGNSFTTDSEISVVVSAHLRNKEGPRYWTPKVQKNGSFFVVLPKGSYSLIVRANDMHATSHEFKIKDSIHKVLVRLAKANTKQKSVLEVTNH